ncbi:MAG: endonuclease III domain-containing protein [Candidatus Bathyarchaeia archaeon]
MNGRGAAEALRIIGRHFSGRGVGPDGDAFHLLVATMLSQNTNWRNVERALNNLEAHLFLKPEAFIEAGSGKLEALIRPAGLHRVKAVKLVEASRFVEERLHGDLDGVLKLPLGEARRILMEIPGVGPKTADVLLAFAGGMDVLPVDTHIERVSKRLGLVREGAGYEEVKAGLEMLIPAPERRRMHLALIEFGR